MRKKSKVIKSKPKEKKKVKIKKIKHCKSCYFFKRTVDDSYPCYITGSLKTNEACGEYLSKKKFLEMKKENKKVERLEKSPVKIDQKQLLYIKEQINTSEYSKKFEDSLFDNLQIEASSVRAVSNVTEKLGKNGATGIRVDPVVFSRYIKKLSDIYLLKELCRTLGLKKEMKHIIKNEINLLFPHIVINSNKDNKK